MLVAQQCCYTSTTAGEGNVLVIELVSMMLVTSFSDDNLYDHSHDDVSSTNVLVTSFNRCCQYRGTYRSLVLEREVRVYQPYQLLCCVPGLLYQ